MHDEISVGTKIRNTREARKLSQNGLAHLLGISPAAVCQWETKGTVPRAKTLKKVAEALGVSEGYLATGEEAYPAPMNDDSVSGYIERMKTKIAEAAGMDARRVSIKISLHG